MLKFVMKNRTKMVNQYTNLKRLILKRSIINKWSIGWCKTKIELCWMQTELLSWWCQSKSKIIVHLCRNLRKWIQTSKMKTLFNKTPLNNSKTNKCKMLIKTLMMKWFLPKDTSKGKTIIRKILEGTVFSKKGQDNKCLGIRASLYLWILRKISGAVRLQTRKVWRF